MRFEVARVQRDIAHLADDIGPREATSASFAKAADFVERRFEQLGYRVRRTSIAVPAGNSWGTPVRKGRSVNVIAEPRGFDSRRRHVVVGAHLDTIPVSPGAEDNASGIAVLLELARLVSQKKPPLPVQFIAFGAEEPRGTGDAWHHFGSQQYVADLSRAERRAIRAMVALDRVGVKAGYVPVCLAGPRGTGLRPTCGPPLAEPRCERERASTSPVTTGRTRRPASRRSGSAASRTAATTRAGTRCPSSTAGQLTKVGRVMWTWLSRD